MDAAQQAFIRRMYIDEATSAQIYSILALRAKSANNKNVLEGIARDEAKHARYWGAHLTELPKPRAYMVRLFVLLAKFLGLSFAINLLESMEADASASYAMLNEKDFPFAKEMLADEQRHESLLASSVEDDGLSYIGSMVLGVSDAVVEMTGTLAGFTLALSNNTLIALAGFITGIAATLSMASSEYLSTKAEGEGKNPFKAACFTGVAYLFAVLLLLAPYALLRNPFAALAVCLCCAAAVVAGFSFFSSVVRKKPFWQNFREMIAVCFGVAFVSFLIGWAAKVWLDVNL